MPQNLNNNVDSLVGSLHTDNVPLKQPEHTTTFALNAIRESERGDGASIGNEPGNTECYSLREGYVPVGNITMANNEIAIFSTNGSISEIGVASGCKYQSLVRSSCLQFNTNYPIKGEFRVINGCERVVYFQDGFNADKSINLDDLENYLLPGYTLASSNTSKWNCNIMRLVPNYTIPKINLVAVHDVGGITDVGMYSFAFSYVDSSFNETDYTVPTQNLPITNEPFSNGYVNIDGAYSAEHSNRDAALGGVAPTTKAIEFQITNIDTTFKFLQPVVIVSRTGDAVTTEQFKLSRIPISTNTINWVFKGISSTDEAIVLSDITVNKAKYESSKAMAQVENRLLRGNLKERVLDWSEFQKEANKIQSKYVVKAVIDKRDDVNRHPHSKSPHYYFSNLSYMRDEVYAFAIVWLLNNGSESPPLPIPGRKEIDDESLVSSGNSNLHNRNNVTVGNAWDKQLLTVVDDIFIPLFDEINISNVKHLDLGLGDTVERWKIYNTAIETGTWTFEGFWRKEGILAFYECEERYPDIRDCNGVPIYPHTVDLSGNITMDKIRHHKMPDTTLEPHFSSFDNNPTELGTGAEYIYPLGVEFYNIQPPEGMEDEVQGYRIVRADRTIENKTVFDKGVLEASYIEAYFGIPLGPSINNTLQDQTYYPMPFNFTPDLVGGIANTDTDFTIQTFWSPKTYLKENAVTGNYIKIERILEGEAGFFENTSGGLEVNGFNLSSNKKTIARTFLNKVLPTYEREDTHRAISQSVYKGFLQEEDSSVSAGDAYETFIQRAAYLDLSDPLIPTFNTDIVSGGIDLYRWYYISVKRNIDPYCNLDTLSYIITNTNCEDTSTDTTLVFGGDCFISSMYYKKVFYQARKTGIGGAVNNTNLSATSIGFFVESEVNTSLRHEGEDLAEKVITASGNTSAIINKRAYFPKSYNGSIIYDNGNVREQLWDYLLLHYTIPEWKAYNDDYSKITRERVFSPLPSTFDFCTDCDGEYRNRITYSETSFQDITSDNFKSELANNFIDMPANNGQITNIFSKDHNIFVTTEDMPYKLITSPQQLQVTDANITFGTGAFLPVPPVEMSSSEYGQAGNQGRFNIRVTEHGVFTVDQERGKVYEFRQGFNPISDIGMRSWFKQNLPNRWSKQYKDLTGVVYPYLDNPYHEFGEGITSVYDPRYERLILHKKDYRWNISDLGTWISDNTNYIDTTYQSHLTNTNLSDSNSSTVLYDLGRYLLTTLEITEAGLYRLTGQLDVQAGTAAGDVEFEIFVDSNQVVFDDTPVLNSIHAHPINGGGGASNQKYYSKGQVINVYMRIVNASTITGWSVDLDRIDYSITDRVWDTESEPFTVTHEWASGDLFDLHVTGPSTIFRFVVPKTGRYIRTGQIVLDGAQDLLVQQEVGLYLNGFKIANFDNINGSAITLNDTYTLLSNLSTAPVWNEGDVVEVRAKVFNTIPLLMTSATVQFTNASFLPLDQVFAEDEFEDLSWTISYSTKYKGWTSWHSYKPDFMYGDSVTFYSGTGNHNMWVHGNRNYQTYYGITYPHMIEFVINQAVTQRLNAVHWHSSVYHYDADNLTEVFEEAVTYDNMLIYNEHQTTGDMLLVPKFEPYEGIFYDPVLKAISRVDDMWKVGQLRDIVADKSIPMFSRNWNDVGFRQFFSNNQGYIDKAINPLAIDTDKSFYEQLDLKDKWHKVRMSVEGTLLDQDYKYVLDLTSTITMNTKR